MEGEEEGVVREWRVRKRVWWMRERVWRMRVKV